MHDVYKIVQFTDRYELIENIYILYEDINEGKSYFRYFDNYNLDNLNPEYVIFVELNNKIIGYGHIDYDDFNWIGLVVSDLYKGRGVGRFICENLIDIAKKNNMKKLRLSVDFDNLIARKLYESLNFKEIEFNNKNIIMELNLEIVKK